jgi:hypothetical protein
MDIIGDDAGSMKHPANLLADSHRDDSMSDSNADDSSKRAIEWPHEIAHAPFAISNCDAMRFALCIPRL